MHNILSDASVWSQAGLELANELKKTCSDFFNSHNQIACHAAKSAPFYAHLSVEHKVLQHSLMPSYCDANMYFGKTEYMCKFKRARKKILIYLCAVVYLTKYFQVLRQIISEVGRRDEMALKFLVDMFVWVRSPSRQNFSLLKFFG